jgi:hypothetical protein
VRSHQSVIAHVTLNESMIIWKIPKNAPVVEGSLKKNTLYIADIADFYVKNHNHLAGCVAILATGFIAVLTVQKQLHFKYVG